LRYGALLHVYTFLNLVHCGYATLLFVELNLTKAAIAKPG